ncbi:zinc finger protein 1035 isoform 1-T3 [Menidia menidia]
MAHGWDSYFHNLTPLSSDSGTLRTSESEGNISQHSENVIGHNVFSGTAALQEAPLPNSDFNTNYCTNPSLENSNSDCVYQRYCSEVQWQADGEQLEKDYLQRCGNGDFPDFATEGLPTSESFPSSFAPDLHGLKQDCEILASSCLENYSDVSSCSDTDVTETRPSCKFMEKDSFPKQKTEIFSKDSSSESFFTETGNITFLTESLCANISETNVLPSNVKDGEHLEGKVSCAQEIFVGPENTIKNDKQRSPSSTTSSTVATTEGESAFDGYDHEGFQEKGKKDNVERNLKVCSYSDLSLPEDMTGDGNFLNPVDKEEQSQIMQTSPDLFNSEQQHLDEKPLMENKNGSEEFNLDSTYGLERNSTDNALDKCNVVRKAGSSVENKITNDNEYLIANSTVYGVQHFETECQVKEIQNNTPLSADPPACKEQQSFQSFVQESCHKSLGETSDEDLSIANVDKGIKKDGSCQSSTTFTPAVNCSGSCDIQASSQDKQGFARLVEPGLQLSRGAHTNSQEVQKLPREANITEPSKDADSNGTKNTNAENSAIENGPDAAIHVHFCSQENGLSTDILPSLEIEVGLSEKFPPAFTPGPHYSAPSVTNDNLSIDIDDKNTKGVDCPDSCLQPNSLGTSINPYQEMETNLLERKTLTVSPSPDNCGPRVTGLDHDAKGKNRQSVETKPKSSLQSDGSNTDLHPCIADQHETQSESITFPTNLEFNGQAVKTNTNCCAEEWMDAEKKMTISRPDQLHSVNKGPKVQKAQNSVESISENEDSNTFKEDQSMPDPLFGEPLSREDSSCDSDEIDIDPSELGKTTVKEPVEESALHLKSFLQMRNLLHPVVILNTSVSTDGMNNSYHCTVCQHTTHKVDDFIEHHHCCHPMLSFKYCQICSVYLINNENGKKHLCSVNKETPRLSTSSISRKKGKFMGRHNCSKCGLIFSKLIHYIQHMRSHTGKTPYKCNGCDLYFAQSSSLRRHKSVPGRCKLSQLPVRNCDANISESKTSPQKDVPQNIFNHSMKKCYVRLVDISRRNLCHICGKSFASAEKTKKHIYSVHQKKKSSADQSATNDTGGDTSERNNKTTEKYKCPLCPRLFKYSYNRARHLRDCVRNAIYGGKEKVEHKYVCPLCKAAFTLASNRYRHIKSICLKESLNRLAKERANLWKDTEKQKINENVQEAQSTENEQNAVQKEHVLKEKRKKHEPKKKALQASSLGKPIPRYKCYYCPALFCHPSGKYRHMKKHDLTKLTGEKFKYRNSVLSFGSKPQTESSTKTEETTEQLQTAAESKCPELSCRFCGKSFTALSSRTRHEQNHRGERPYRCLECGKGFKKHAHLIGHRIVHQKKVQCTVCKDIFPTVGELLQHRRSHLKRGMLQCPDCQAQFQYPAHLLRHLKTHSNKNKKAREPKETAISLQQSSETVKEQNQKQVECTLCKEVFDDLHILRKHCLTHISGSSLNECPFCKVSFNDRRYLLRHMDKHTGDKPLSCTNCGKRFYRSVFLRLHSQKCFPPQTSHSVKIEPNNKANPKPLSCHICPRQFCKKDRWQNHIIGHRKNTLLLCSGCGQYFGQNKIGQHKLGCSKVTESLNEDTSTTCNLKKSPLKASQIENKRPLKSRPTVVLKFKCHYCPQRFRYRSLYLRHLVSHTGVQPYACMRCGNRFGSQTMCLQHEAFCDGVPKQGQPQVKCHAAAEMDSLREATQNPQPQCESEFKCKFCTKTFLKARNLRCHILTHNEVKPYRCKACDSCFSRYDHLKVHQARCKAKKKRLEVRIPKISLDDVGKGWQSKFGIKPNENQETFNCEVCLRSFPSKSKLSRHFTMFHATKPFPCTRCSASFSHEKTLKQHKRMRKCRKPRNQTNASLPLGINQPSENVTRTIDGMRSQILVSIQPLLNQKFKYFCGYCPRAFKNSWQLGMHTRLHTGEKPYPCEYCGERFMRKDYVNRHYIKCTKKQQNNQVLCDRCGGFFSKTNLENHKKTCTLRQGSSSVSKSQQPTVSSPPKGFSCAYCNSRFLLFSQLQEHFLSTHKMETVNPQVSSAPLQQLLLNIPNIKEEPMDESCEERLNDHNLVRKQDIPHNSGSTDQLVCQKCNMSFTNKAGLVGHQRVHATELPFNCKICKRGFWNKTVLRNHYRKCRLDATQRLEVPLKAKIDFALNDSKVVIKEEPETTSTGVLQTNVYNDDSKVESQQSSEEQKSSNKEKKTVQYQCSECDKSFTDGLMLISHLEDHGREEQERKRNTCTQCGRVCSSQANLEKHLKLHGISPKYPCSDCSKVFPTISDLDKHRTLHNTHKPFSCKLCKQSFFSRPSLCDHFSSDHADDVYYCHFCSKVYAVKKSLARHYKRWHPNEWKDIGSAALRKGSSDQLSSSHVSTTGESDEDEINGSDSNSDSAPYFPCHVCGKTFSTSESLEDHQLCHLGEKPHECAECGKCFFQATQLQQHQRMHKSEYQCQTCGRGFVTLFALRNHKHSHGKNRPHRCSKCLLSFTGPTQLAEHMSTHREESFPCDMCSRVFQSKSTRAEHRKSHSKAEDYPSASISRGNNGPSVSSSFYLTDFKYRCGICRERFRDPEELSEHGCMQAKERPYSCTDCNKHFLHPSHLKKHQTTHQPLWLMGDCEYPCSQCNSRFLSSAQFLCHLKSHVDTVAEAKGEEPSNCLICPICHQWFASATQLIHHFSTHPDASPKHGKKKLNSSESQVKQHKESLKKPAEYECRECGESFSGVDFLRRHRCSNQNHCVKKSKHVNRSAACPSQVTGEEEEIDVTGEDLFKCPECSKQFSSKSGLLEHQNKHHMDEKRFKCEHCEKQFSKMRYLRKHESRHRLKESDDTVVDGVKTRFKCAQCHAKFNTAQELSFHMTIHAGEYRCDMCYKSFSQRSLLKHHQESHVGEVVYECTECEKAFAFPHLLEEHQQTHNKTSH